MIRWCNMRLSEYHSKSLASNLITDHLDSSDSVSC